MVFPGDREGVPRASDRVARLLRWAKGEVVLCVAFACAAVSCVAVPPSAAYAGYLDLRVLVLLFCLMAAVAGLTRSGLLAWCAARLVSGEKSRRRLAFVLVMLPFFASMLVTNDVALLAFVPFAVMALGSSDMEACLPRVVVLQAVAANLGGMLTPVGNPQNLYLYTHYELGLGEFLGVLAPFVALAFVLLAIACRLFGRAVVRSDWERDGLADDLVGCEPVGTVLDRRGLAVHGFLFCACLLCVLRVLPYPVLLGVVLATLALFDRAVLRRVDYALLATFVCFFVFSGNVASIPAVHDWLAALMGEFALGVSVVLSQVVSNVPAAVLLSGFTDNWPALLAGVDIGGLGTPVASLASLIALRLYMKAPRASMGRFMGEFLVINALFLVAMLSLHALLAALA